MKNLLQEVFRVLKDGGMAFIGGGFGKGTPRELIDEIADESRQLNARRMSRRFWGRKMQFIVFVRAKNRAERSPKGVGSIGLVRRSALRGAVQVQSSIRRALGRSAKRSALTVE